MQNKRITLTIAILFLLAGNAIAAQTCNNGIVEGTEQCDDGSTIIPGITYISDCQGLQNMQNNLAGNYALSQDIDCTITNTWANTTGTIIGFQPVGTSWITSNPFTGTLNGNGHKITNLFENQSIQQMGLFGSLENATISNLTIENVDITGVQNTGALFGIASGNTTITNCRITGTVKGSESTGGLGGMITGNTTITNSRFTGTLSTVGSPSATETNTGGLIGQTNGQCTITNSFSEGTIGGSVNIGGLVGLTSQNTSITNCYSTANVTGTFDSGGLVGQNNGNISQSYAKGNVNGGIDTGGLVGDSEKTGSITKCNASGNVTGLSSTGGLGPFNAGGLVGENNSPITESFATGNVTGTLQVGGLVGLNTTMVTSLTGTITDSYSTGKIHLKATGIAAGGLIGINNYQITNSYSKGLVETEDTMTTAGGLVAFGSLGVSTCTSSYWNTTDSGQANSFCGTKETQPDMKLGTTYAGWDFANVWKIDSSINNGYPFLRFEDQTYYCGDGTCQSPFENQYNCPEDCVPLASQCPGQCLSDCTCPTTPTKTITILSMTLEPNYIAKTETTNTTVNAIAIIKNNGTTTNVTTSLTAKDSQGNNKTTDATPQTTSFQTNETKTVTITFTIDDSWNGQYLITMQTGKTGSTTPESSAAQVITIQPAIKTAVPEIPLAASGLFAIATLIIIALTKKRN